MSFTRCLFAAFCALACIPGLAGDGTLVGTPSFDGYWFTGEAELSRYELEQSRYGEIREGDAVLVFVTEDFLPDKQVKSDSADRARTGALPVLKLNFTKKFNTGLYPYSIMTSIFTPLRVDAYPRTLKTSTSVQEWCGHTWLQLNLRDDEYRLTGHSYFESEGDERRELPAGWLEEEIWTRIRVAPSTLPTGDLAVIPGGEQSRLRHRPLEVERATATRTTGKDDSETYTLQYRRTGRKLSIRFNRAFPHEILGWEETDRGGTTRATRTHVLKTDYWARSGNDDARLREKLGLD
jgi:hypothetical protein